MNPAYRLPPSRPEGLPEDHCGRFVGEGVETLALAGIDAKDEEGDGRGLAA